MDDFHVLFQLKCYHVKKCPLWQDTMKFLEESIGRTLSNMNHRDVFQSISQNNGNKNKNKQMGLI